MRNVGDEQFSKILRGNRPMPPDVPPNQKQNQKDAIWKAISQSEEIIARPGKRPWLKIAVPGLALVLLGIVSLTLHHLRNAARDAEIGESVASAMTLPFIDEDQEDEIDDLILLADGE
jgi:hypothetical protein